MLRAAAAAIRARGWNFRCAFTPIAAERAWHADLEADGVAVELAPGWGRGELLSWLEDATATIDGPLLMHTHFTAFDLPARALAGRRSDTNVLWHVHSYLPHGVVAGLKTAVKVGVLGRGVDVLCVSEDTAAGMRRRGARRVHLIENGIQTDRFPVIGAEERSRARDALGLAPSDRALLHFAWDWEVKGGPLFAETLARLDGDPSWIGLSVGGGEHATAAAAQLGNDDRMRPLSQTDDVRSLYAAADALLASSVAEGMPFAVLEALSCGLPIVATDVAGHRVASPLPPGVTLAPIDAGALSSALEAAVPADPAQRGPHAQAAHDWAVAERDVGRWAERVVALYDEILA
jgi:glycosyltransferase involved in cell wall biosynthesis